MRRLPAPLPYRDARALAATPHVVVDGASDEASVLCLSHWPASPTPRRLWRDLSAEIALEYLNRPRYWRHGAVAVTNDHLDEDGLCALFALVEPSAAERTAPLLVDVARAGDFAVAPSDAARSIVLALHALFDPERSVLAPGASLDERDPMAWAAHCYAEGLARLPELLEHPDRFASWGAEESGVVARDEEFLDRHCDLREDAELDLAVFVSSSEPDHEPVALGHSLELPLHPLALHHRTSRARILLALGSRVCYYDRYETWVRYMSERHALRRDLAPLAEELSADEPGGISWTADAPGALVPVLRPTGGHSGLGHRELEAKLRDYLRRAPASWNPYAASIDAVRTSGREAPRGGTTGRGPFRSRGPRPRAR